MELDFFALEEAKSAASAAYPRLLEPLRISSLRGVDMQSLIARIDPQLMRRVIAAGLPHPPAVAPPCPALIPESKTGSNGGMPETAPMTIFYNGTVSVFNLTPNKAQSVMSMAGEVSVTDGGNGSVAGITGYVPTTRRTSLLRFLEGRKKRLAAVGPHTRGKRRRAPHKDGSRG